MRAEVARRTRKREDAHQRYGITCMTRAECCATTATSTPFAAIRPYPCVFNLSLPTFCIRYRVLVDLSLHHLISHAIVLQTASSFVQPRAPRIMAAASIQYTLPSPLPKSPYVLFRAECARNTTFRASNLVARGPDMPITGKAFHDCLSWNRVPTPFIPFTNSWERAMQRREKLIEDGERDVIIIAIWAKGLHDVYDAYDVARGLGYRQGSRNRRQRLENHLDEYLVCGGVPADEYRILAIFHGHGQRQDLALSIPGLRGFAVVPPEFVRDVPGRTPNEKLENEIYQNTGIRGQSEKLFYLVGKMVGAFGIPGISVVVS